MKPFLCTLLRSVIPTVFFSLLMSPATVQAQVNANNRVPVNTIPFQYGVNPGYYGNGWTDPDIADITVAAGSFSFRASLPSYFADVWGYNVRVNEFGYYAQKGMKAHAMFLGEPSDANTDKTVFPPATAHSLVFKNLYQPIWDNGENGTPVNDNNPFAVYIYNVVKAYGNRVLYWEIVNEPDFTYFWDNANRSQPGNWYDNPPGPEQLTNLRAPVFYYIRMLRIAYEVVKSLYPDSYVTPGGLGYPAFMDALLRYTDNPDNGKVTPQYPLKGGAYFDIASLHSYPAHNLSVWDNGINGRRWFRHSDAAVNEIFRLKGEFDQVLEKHGYNGTTYPKKPWILTEFNIPRKSFGDHYGGDDAQRNFIIKASVESQKFGIQQFYILKTGEGVNYSDATDFYELMGLYENLKRDKKGQQKFTKQGKALKTTSQLLYEWTFDATRTQALMLPSNVGGGAFKKGDKYRYVLWAKTSVDRSEAAQGTYSFPASLKIDSVVRYEWDYSIVPSSQSQIKAQNIALTSTPAFFELMAGVKDPLPVNIISFDVQNAECKAAFDWKISFDEPGLKLRIEESDNGKDFKAVYSAALSAKNSTSSVSLDTEPAKTKSFRLVVETAAGAKTFSAVKTVMISCEDSVAHLQLYPNPAKDAVLVKGLKGHEMIILYDNAGKKLKSQIAGSRQARLSLDGLAPSTYHVRIHDTGSNTFRTLKFLKE